MATVLIRTAIIYVLFTIAIRLMGKRQVGELQISELITTFMLSELAINPIQDISIPIAYALVPLVFLFSMEVITSFLVTKLPKFRRAFMGAPSIIIRSGFPVNISPAKIQLRTRLAQSGLCRKTASPMILVRL